ncbi:hypothetical protein [Nocardioides taihuensis]|uniref:Uncharacterized protein n=1 Tax=Nocardioides taihuensis TaxID=1835606 RepID=A0ABW0BN09_9ACTN
MPASSIRTRTTAVLGAAALLVVGAAGGGYAAGKITGKDIKDGTVTSADVKDGTLKSADVKDGSLGVRDLSPATAEDLAPRLVYSRTGDGIYLPDDDSNTLVQSLALPEGRWLVTVSATAFPHVFSNDPQVPWISCELEAPDNGFARTNTTVALPGEYASLGTQLVVLAASDRDATFTCHGHNVGINQVTMTGVEVGAVTEVTP